MGVVLSLHLQLAAIAWSDLAVTWRIDADTMDYLYDWISPFQPLVSQDQLST